MRWLNSAKDIVNAMVWPGACMVAGSRLLRLVSPSPVAAPETRSPARQGDRSPAGVPSDERATDLRNGPELGGAGK
jgi:hypothetical protein